MQFCSDCGVELNEENSYFRNTENRFQPYCKTCLYERQKKRWRQRKRDAVEYKGGCCIECGYNKYFGALEFHHRDPSIKIANWNKIRLWSWSRITEELDKCDLLCSNCHKEEHGNF